MTTPQESRSIAVNPAALPKRLFMSHQDKDALAGTAALAYIQWGEAQGYHRRPSCKSRQRWYDLREQNTVRLAMNKLVHTTARTFFTADGMLASDNFQVIVTGDECTEKLCIAMNSTLHQLFLNVEARTNFGEGVLEIQTYETSHMLVARPQMDMVIFDSDRWDVMDPSDERQHIDQAVFDALDLITSEREAVYAGVTELVDNRRQRARSTADRNRR